MDQRPLQSHEIEKTISESDNKFRKKYYKLVKSTKILAKKFNVLEESGRKKVSKGNILKQKVLNSTSSIFSSKSATKKFY